MKRNTSSHSYRDERPKSSRSEDRDTAARPRNEEEKLKRRREWELQQERDREHERLKRKMILEYEIRRAREKGLPLPEDRSTHRSRSKSRSKSLRDRHRRTSSSNTNRTSVLSQKLEPSGGKMLLFKGPEGTQISVTELRRIKVDIQRNIPANVATSDLQRDIVNPEDVVLKRRDGEGSKPIFDREEIKKAVVKMEEVEEHRTVVAVDSETSVNKPETSRKRSVSLNSLRATSHSPRRTSSRLSRHEGSKHRNDRQDYYGNHKSERDRKRSRDRSSEHRENYKEKDRRHTSPHKSEEDRLRKRKDRREDSCSRERDQRKWDRDSRRRSPISVRSREYRERSRERSRERRESERNERERRVPPPHYIEQVPVPIYYGNFPPRPIVVGPPMVAVHGQIPPRGRMRHPRMMGPVRPFPPRFMPPEMFRLGLPPNPRFGPMF